MLDILLPMCRFVRIILYLRTVKLTTAG